MERKIGEIFEYHGEWYQCLEEKTCTCFGCDFRGYNCAGISLKEVKGSCQSERRKDNKSVIFKKLEKVGDPYLAHDHSRNKDVVIQDYKLYNQHACYNGNERMLSFGLYGKNEIVTIKTKEPIIEIKQNKEDMGDNDDIRPYDELFSPGTVSNTKYLAKEDVEEKKLNLKSFDLEAAKAGKPVCTRDGRKARIICFDRINGDYYKIVACVTAFDGNFEEVLFYGIDGYIVDSQNPKDEDLMIRPEKKEGWILLRKDGCVFDNEEVAKKNCTDDYFVAKVEWEE